MSRHEKLYLKQDSPLVSAENTNRAAITKGVSIGLIPVPATMGAMEEKETVKRDREAADNTKKLYPLIDSVIREILITGLPRVNAEIFGPLSRVYDKMPPGRGAEGTAVRKELDKVRKGTSSKIAAVICSRMPFGLKGSKDIVSSGIFRAVRDKAHRDREIAGLQEDDVEALLNSIPALLTVSTKYLISRKSILETQAPARVLENYVRYRVNAERIRRFQQQYPDEFDNFEEQFPRLKDALDTGRYCSFVTPDGIDLYNELISGRFNADGVCIAKGYNNLIIELKHNASKFSRKQTASLRQIAPMHKQVLFEEKKAYVPKKITSDEEVSEFVCRMLDSTDGWLKKAEELFLQTETGAIPVKGKYLHRLSHILTGDHSFIPDKAVAETEAGGLEQNRNIPKKGRQKRNVVKISDTAERVVFSLEVLDRLSFGSSSDSDGQKNLVTLILDQLHEMRNRLFGCAHGETSLIDALRQCIASQQSSGENKEMPNHIRPVLDELVFLRSFLQCFSMDHMAEDELPEWADDYFTDGIIGLCDELLDVTKTKHTLAVYFCRRAKDRSETFPLYFGVPDKTHWFDVHRKTGLEKGAYALAEKDGRYFIFGLFGDVKQIPTLMCCDEYTDHYNVLSIRKMQAAYQALPKKVFANKAAAAAMEDKSRDSYIISDKMTRTVTVSRSLYDAYHNGLIKKTNERTGEYRKLLTKLIRLYMDVLLSYTETNMFDFSSLKSPVDYENMAEFYADVDACAYERKYVMVSAEQIDQLAEEGKLFLFMLYSMSMYDPKMRKSGYTKLILEMLSEENCTKRRIYINSAPSITLRPAVFPGEVTHKKGSILLNKHTSDGEKIPEDVYRELYMYLNGSAQKEGLSSETKKWIPRIVFKEADFDILKDRRYTKDRYTLNMTYVLYRDAGAFSHVLQYNGENKAVVVRGPNHLLYMTVFDREGNTLIEESLDKILGTDYRKLLKSLKKQAKDAQRNWLAPVSISRIQEAYVVAASSRIINVAMAHEAVIVTEKTTRSLRKNRDFLEGQVMGALGNALCKRAACYSSKNTPDGQPGSQSVPLQLADPDYQTARNGILSFVNAAYTNMCPFTGFVQLFDRSAYSTAAKKRAFFQSFEYIGYEESSGSMKFSFDYQKFALSTTESSNPWMPVRTKWSVFIRGDYSVYKYPYRKQKTYDDVGRVLIEMIRNEISDGTTSGNLVLQIAQLTNETVEFMFRVFMDMTKGVIYPSNTDERFRYRSAADPMAPDLLAEQALSRIFLEKSIYEWERMDMAKEGSKKRLPEWVDYYQAKKAQ